MLIAACALLLFELAAYFALVQRWDAIWSAVALGSLNLESHPTDYTPNFI